MKESDESKCLKNLREHSDSIRAQKKVAVFDDFAYSCHYSTSVSWLRNGYVCEHPEQKEKHIDGNRNAHGACYCLSCPLGIKADENCLNDQNIDWDGLSLELKENEYLIINISNDATFDEKATYNSYLRYINRTRFIGARKIPEVKAKIKEIEEVINRENDHDHQAAMRNALLEPLLLELLLTITHSIPIVVLEARCHQWRKERGSL